MPNNQFKHLKYQINFQTFLFLHKAFMMLERSTLLRSILGWYLQDKVLGNKYRRICQVRIWVRCKTLWSCRGKLILMLVQLDSSIEMCRICRLQMMLILNRCCSPGSIWDMVDKLKVQIKVNSLTPSGRGKERAPASNLTAQKFLNFISRYVRMKTWQHLQ